MRVTGAPPGDRLTSCQRVARSLVSTRAAAAMHGCTGRGAGGRCPWRCCGVSDSARRDASTACGDCVPGDGRLGACVSDGQPIPARAAIEGHSMRGLGRSCRMPISGDLLCPGPLHEARTRGRIQEPAAVTQSDSRGVGQGRVLRRLGRVGPNRGWTASVPRRHSRSGLTRRFYRPPVSGDAVAVCQARSSRLPDRLEEGDQFLGDGLGCDQRGKVPDVR